MERQCCARLKTYWQGCMTIYQFDLNAEYGKNGSFETFYWCISKVNWLEEMVSASQTNAWYVKRKLVTIEIEISNLPGLEAMAGTMGLLRGSRGSLPVCSRNSSRNWRRRLESSERPADAIWLHHIFASALDRAASNSEASPDVKSVHTNEAC